MMDVISIIHEELLIVYSIIPKELFIIILGGIITTLIFNKKETNAEKNDPKI